MRRRVMWSLLVLSVSIVALLALGSIGFIWNQRADDICREKAPRTASGYSITWEWGEFAYVCDYGRTDENPRRVGITEALHRGRGGRHPFDR